MVTTVSPLITIDAAAKSFANREAWARFAGGTTMIELLGIGVADEDGRWLVRRVCAEITAGTVTAVVARTPEERAAVLDAASGHRIPVEGRVWIARIPLMRETAGRIRGLVPQARSDAPLAARRSLTWNVLAVRGPFGGLVRLPRPDGAAAAARALDAVGLTARAVDRASGMAPLDRARLHIARALLRGPCGLVLPDVDGLLSAGDGRALMSVAHTVARMYRLAVVVAVGDSALVNAGVDRVLAIADGSLIFDGPPARFGGTARAAGICA